MALKIKIKLYTILFNVFKRLTALPRGRDSKNSDLSIGGNAPFLAPLKQKIETVYTFSPVVTLGK